MTERAMQLPSTKPKALILRLCLSFSRSSRVKGDKSSILAVRLNSLETVSSLRKWTSDFTWHHLAIFGVPEVQFIWSHLVPTCLVPGKTSYSRSGGTEGIT